MPAIAEGDAVTRAAGILIEASRQLEVPVVVTEQYPKGLGPTVDAIAGRLPNDAAVVEKMTFSAARNHDFGAQIDDFKAAGRDHIVVCGVESHVCVMQTAADLDAQGCTVHIVADACGSRAPASKDAALARFGALGISRRDHRDGSCSSGWRPPARRSSRLSPASSSRRARDCRGCADEGTELC